MNRISRFLLSCLLAGLLAPGIHAAGVAATENQVKAVFVYNFSHFVDWPAGAFATPTEPFVIGVIGSDAFAAQLEEVVRGERVNNHTLLVQRFHDADAIRPCHILFIDQSGGAQLERILAQLKGRSTLTVSDLDGASQRGVMMQFARADNRIRLRINVESAREAGLTISSNLLRPAEIVRTSSRE